MLATGLTLPSNRPPQQLNVGGIMAIKSLNTLMSEQITAAAVDRANTASSEAVVQSLVSHINRHWQLAKEAKIPIEREMLSAVRSRRGEYDPDKLLQIKKQGGSEIFMLVFATKARQMKALLSDVFISSGAEKTWTIAPTPVPNMPQELVELVLQAVYEETAQLEMAGVPVSTKQVQQRLMDTKEATENQMNELARKYAENAENAIEDAMDEGKWLESLDQFLDDLTVFKTAFLKGPVVRNTRTLTWSRGADGKSVPTVSTELRPQWDRVDPFMLYPAPWSRTTDDAFLFERHQLSRADLSAMIGVDGYSEDAIRAALDAHGSGGLHEWLTVDTQKSEAEGRSQGSSNAANTDLIDALQYWGSVSGKMLREWGMKNEEVPDEAKEYEVEVWLIGKWAVKAVINADPLARRPYFADGFSRIPGAFWHNSLFDVTRDCGDMCNSAARALANNLGISSGPQVVVNIDRLPLGEEITELYPWKIHQVTNDPMGSGAKPVDFFQPSSNASELMGVFERFSNLADEYSGVPKYMTGLAGGEGGAGRTASGMSMMIGNASKQVKQTVASIDIHVVCPAVDRAYEWEMLYNPNTDIKGDLQVCARGATSMAVKEQAQVRRNEFLMTTGNPIDMQIIGLEGRAEVLREAAKGLGMNTDKIIPNATVLKQRAEMAQQQAAMQAQQEAHASGNGQELMDGAATTDNFSPPAGP